MRETLLRLDCCVLVACPLKVLPEILPHVRVPEHGEEEPQFDSWEEAAGVVNMS